MDFDSPWDKPKTKRKMSTYKVKVLDDYNFSTPRTFKWRRIKANSKAEVLRKLKENEHNVVASSIKKIETKRRKK